MIPRNFSGGTKQNKQLCVADRVKSLCFNFGLKHIKKINEEEGNTPIHNLKQNSTLLGLRNSRFNFKSGVNAMYYDIGKPFSTALEKHVIYLI